MTSRGVLFGGSAQCTRKIPIPPPFVPPDPPEEDGDPGGPCPYCP